MCVCVCARERGGGTGRRTSVKPHHPPTDSPEPGNTLLCQMLRWGLEKQQRSEDYFYYFLGGGGVKQEKQGERVSQAGERAPLFSSWTGGVIPPSAKNGLFFSLPAAAVCFFYVQSSVARREGLFLK